MARWTVAVAERHLLDCSPWALGHEAWLRLRCGTTVDASALQLKGVDASFRDSVFVCFLLLPSDHSIQRTSPSLFRKCTSHTLAARVAILLPFFPHHVGPTPSFSAPSCVRCHQSTPSARCIGCRSLPHGTHLSCAQLENRKGVEVSAQPHQPTPHLLHAILHST